MDYQAFIADVRDSLCERVKACAEQECSEEETRDCLAYFLVCAANNVASPGQSYARARKTETEQTS